MQSIDPLDKHLDPPDLPTHGPCDRCGTVMDNGDLTKIKRGGEWQWYCDDCLEIVMEEMDDE